MIVARCSDAQSLAAIARCDDRAFSASCPPASGFVGWYTRTAPELAGDLTAEVFAIVTCGVLGVAAHCTAPVSAVRLSVAARCCVVIFAPVGLNFVLLIWRL